MLLNQPQIISPIFDESASCVVSCDDSLSQLRKLPDQKFQLIISSPPYNLGKVYERQLDLKDYLVWQQLCLVELYRILLPSGSIIWQTGNYVVNGEVFPLDMQFYPLFKQLGMQLRNRIIWHFDHGLHASKRFSGRYETLLWFSKTNDYCFNLDPVRIPSKYPGKLHYKGPKAGLPSGNPMGKNPSDYWVISEQDLLSDEWECGLFEIPNVKHNHPEKTDHPCQFPVALAERCVMALSNPDDWVLDPFGGVGTSVIAALKRGRRGMSIDRDANYCDLATQRIQQFQQGILKTRPMMKKIHQPSGREKVAQSPESWQTANSGRLI